MGNVRVRGFTLVELLAALAVIGVLAVAGYRALATLLEAEAHIDAQTRRWAQVSQLLAQLERDVSLADARTVRDPSGATQPTLLAANDLFALTRFGDEGSGGAQAAPRRVGYRLREGTLEYLVWPSLDAAAGAAASFPVLENVAAFRVAALNAAGTPATHWPVGNPAALPRALQAELVLDSGERLTRTFLLR